MLPRKMRALVPRALRARLLYISRYLSVKGGPNKQKESMFGVVISNSVEPLSVRRHGLKRKILGEVRTWKFKEAYDVVFILTRAVVSLSHHNLRGEIEKAHHAIVQYIITEQQKVSR
ncbi:MAG: ribonuclease P protein component [Patescibacteria group bacterium]|nr:ribonuclease P protein component [Patescibacteria group bacterium]